MTKKTAARFTAPDVGERLRLLRRAHGIKTQRDVATLIGVDVNRYNNWECGVPIPVPFAIKLCDHYGVTLDYIYRGRIAGVAFSLVETLNWMSAE